MNTFDLRTVEEKLHDLAPLALAFARGHEQGRCLETSHPNMAHGKKDDSHRVAVALDTIPDSGSFVARVTLDGVNLCLSDPWTDAHVALDNLRWLLCGTGAWVTPRGARREA